jgi:hypothetical protein
MARSLDTGATFYRFGVPIVDKLAKNTEWKKGTYDNR